MPAYIRAQRGTHINPRPFGPRDTDDWPAGVDCPACGRPFLKGEYTALVPIGPGRDEEAPRKALAGRYYNAVAIEAHWGCVTGEADPVERS